MVDSSQTAAFNTETGPPPSLDQFADSDFSLEALWGLDYRLLELLPIGVYLCDAEGRLVRWNRYATELWGRVPRAGDDDERFCGSYRLFRLNGVVIPREACPMAVCLRTGEPQRMLEAVVERPDGSRRIAMVNIAPIRDPSGTIIGAVNVFHDITEKKRAEDALVQSEKRFRQLLEKLPAAAYTCDASGLITYYNEHAVELWGRAPNLQDPLDRFCGSWRLYSRDGEPIRHDECWMAFTLREGCDCEGNEIIIERPDGSRRNVLAHATPFYDETGALAGAVNVVVDITEQKETQARINELLRKEQEHSEKLREADRRKDEFLAMLGHELRNPLAPIRTGLELLSMDESGDRETLQLMCQQVDHLVRLVDDLLDVSRIVRGRVELRRTSIELSETLKQSVDGMRSVIERRGQELIVTIPPEPIWLHADAVRLVQVVENLLNNASKYTDDGGRIELSAERRGDAVVVAVQDNGIGIEPDLLPTLFDLFTQSSRSLDRSQGGLGIGLTLVKNLVEMHGGTVSAHSEGVGRGSRFEITLPIQPSAPPSEDAPQQSAPADTRRVLVVDDNVGAARMLSLLVRRLGPHDVEVAHDGAAAIALAERFQPDIILLDIGLPKMDGLTVARTLRRNPAFQQTLLVALTGYGQDQDRQNSREAGFDEHLVKPVNAETLRQVLFHSKLAHPR